MPPRRALVTITGSWLLVMCGANLAAPLYAVYAMRFGFSSLVLTLVFTTYAFVLIPSLVVFGGMSDRFGRTPVLLAGLAVAAVALVVFAAATSVAWLFAARALQGLAVGMISGPATAALVEFDPRRNERRPALLAGLAQAGGSGLGPLVSGPLAQWGPFPLRLSFVLLLVATGLAALAAARLPEQDTRRTDRWRIQRPRLPEGSREAFARVSVTAGLAWAAVALSLSIVPSYAHDLLGTSDLALLGAVAALALAASAFAQVVSQRRRPDGRLAQTAGLAAIAAGLGALALAAPERSLLLLLGGAVAAGAGHGVAFLGAQDELNDIAPSERRGEVTAAFICCIYAIVAGAVIGSGLLDRFVSLSVAVAVVAVAVGLSALATAWWQLARSRRPRRHAVAAHRA